MGELGILKERISLCPTWICWDCFIRFRSWWWFITMNFNEFHQLFSDLFKVVFTLHHGKSHHLGESFCLLLGIEQAHRRGFITMKLTTKLCSISDAGERLLKLDTLPETKMAPKTMASQKKKIIFRPSISRGNVSFSKGNYLLRWFYLTIIFQHIWALGKFVSLAWSISWTLQMSSSILLKTQVHQQMKSNAMSHFSLSMAVHNIFKVQLGLIWRSLDGTLLYSSRWLSPRR